MENKTFEELLKESRAEGIELGRSEGIELGRTEGRTEGIYAFIAEFTEEGIPKERIIEKLVKRFSLTSENAEDYYNTYTASV